MSVYISVFFLDAAQFLAYLRFQRLYLSFAMYDLVFIICPPYFACPSGGEDLCLLGQKMLIRRQ